MEKEYVITFKSTTAALRARNIIESSYLKGVIKDTVEVIPVPFNLSETCFGMGLKCAATDEGIKTLYDCLTQEQVDYKNFWLVGKKYISCKQRLERM